MANKLQIGPVTCNLVQGFLCRQLNLHLLFWGRQCDHEVVLEVLAILESGVLEYGVPIRLIIYRHNVWYLVFVVMGGQVEVGFVNPDSVIAVVPVLNEVLDFCGSLRTINLRVG